MAIEDWIDPCGEDDPPLVGCALCDEERLYWSMTINGWRLFNQDDEQHFCEPNADDFEVQ